MRYGVFRTGSGYSEFLDEFVKETDRAAAVLGGAYLDELLRELLEKRFVEGGTKLLRTDGPLGSFGARIAIAYSIGLISKDAYADLMYIKDIRNRFAHRLHGLDFSEQSIKDRCKAIRIIKDVLVMYPDHFGTYPREPRDLFDVAVSALASDLEMQILRTTRIEEGSAVVVWEPPNKPG